FAEPQNVLDRLRRGLVCYISYLAPCEMNAVFTEYMLYEPMLRILTARGFNVNPEKECTNIKQPPKGDKRKLDFVVSQKGFAFAIEVKWAHRKTIDVEEDFLKLVTFKGGVAEIAHFCACSEEKETILAVWQLRLLFAAYPPPRP